MPVPELRGECGGAGFFYRAGQAQRTAGLKAKPAAGRREQASQHEILLRLLRLGLSWREACELSHEDALCLLWHAGLREGLDELAAEAKALSALPFADPHELLKAQSRLQHRQNQLLSEFWREY